MMELAHLNQGNTNTAGACKKCGYIGHLTFQCMNN